MINRINFFLNFLGLYPKTFLLNLIRLPSFFADYIKIIRQKNDDKRFSIGRTYPILTDKFKESGIMSGAYFHQDLLVARKIFKNKPERHLDIGSRIDGFVSHVAVFRPIEILDIRHQRRIVENIIFRQADLLDLPPDLINSTDSISALHSLEHFGLGRYGDRVDYDGFDKVMLNIIKILKPGGKFYLSVPIGAQRIEFNAHRVFSMDYLLNLVSRDYILDSFSYVNDDGTLFQNPQLTKEKINNNFGCHYGCGIFELSKK